MNTLFKITRLPLLAALLCLHFFAVPVQGAQGLPRDPQNPAEHKVEKKNSRTDNRNRADFKATRKGHDRQDQGASPKQRSPRGKSSPDNTGKARSNDPAAMQRALRDTPKSQASVSLGTVTPPADLMRLHTGPEWSRHDSPDQHRDKNRRDSRTVTPRQQPPVQKSLVISRETIRHDDRHDVRRPRVDTRKDHRPRGDSDRHSTRMHNGGNNHRPVTVKHVVHTIPSRHAVVLHGRDRYHYYSGRFYRPWNNGFILVRPPIGLVVLNIPLGSRMVISAGITYHVFGDVHYRRVSSGYQVVEPIRGHSANRPDRVEVVIDLLNIRYGPDTSEAVIAQVGRYTTLRVLGSAPGWFYVEMDGEEDMRGWVMERFVSQGNARG
ncbi:hypothetical protein SAMN04488082_102334 [Desulfomicrobium apsheronum]|uniref:SH3b domain-containing protein n=1 Tax=Desulfomicrobium apsheronum TaxID=52560 RepID=A0A1I3QHV4_9BACT|nr:DUF6515 family protein [Desulfomicrobium apsheronum]SFJ33330.1 hypothetical protein SAMN04488082_102334 [Desulfomicrobium apsheronum]